MMMKLSALVEKIDSLSIRERAVVMFGIIAVLYSLWDAMLMRPLENQQKVINADLQQKQATQTALNVQIQKIISGKQDDPSVALEKNLNALKKELQEINASIQTSTAHLVSPKNMAKILESVLNKTRGLTLIEVKGLGTTPLIPPDKNEKKQDKSAETTATEEKSATNGDGDNVNMGNAYKHGLRIEFEGDYMTTLNFLRQLESLESKFIWDSLVFKVEKYPQSRAAIQVFTLSLQPDWIDV